MQAASYLESTVGPATAGATGKVVPTNTNDAVARGNVV